METLNNLAVTYVAAGKYSDAEGLYKRALAITEKLLGTNINVAQICYKLADVYRAQNKYGEAEGIYKRALAITEQTLGANHRDMTYPLNGLANLYRIQGRSGEAEVLLKRASTLPN